jgi:hypothetical protein
MTFAESSLFDEFYTWVDKGGQTSTTLNVTALKRAIPADTEVRFTDVRLDMAERFLSDGSIEDDRLERLSLSAEALAEPILFATMPAGHHNLIDGRHRFCLHAILDILHIRCIILPWSLVEQFICHDAPSRTEEEILSTPTNLTALRALQAILEGREP